MLHFALSLLSAAMVPSLVALHTRGSTPYARMQTPAATASASDVAVVESPMQFQPSQDPFVAASTLLALKPP